MLGRLRQSFERPRSHSRFLDQRLDFIGRHTFTDAGQVRAARVDGHTEIKVNLDHDAHAELAIQLHDAIDLTRRFPGSCSEPHVWTAPEAQGVLLRDLTGGSLQLAEKGGIPEFHAALP